MLTWNVICSWGPKTDPEISARKKGGNAELNSMHGSSVLAPPCVCWKITQTGAFKINDVHLRSRFWRPVTPPYEAASGEVTGLCERVKVCACACKRTASL